MMKLAHTVGARDIHAEKIYKGYGIQKNSISDYRKGRSLET